MIYFNPRGLRRPRRPLAGITRVLLEISIHEVFADLDILASLTIAQAIFISIHEVFADLDLSGWAKALQNMISIHEVFADLDTVVGGRSP